MRKDGSAEGRTYKKDFLILFNITTGAEA